MTEIILNEFPFILSPWFWVSEMAAAVTIVFAYVSIAFYRLSK